MKREESGNEMNGMNEKPERGSSGERKREVGRIRPRNERLCRDQ